MRKLLVLIFVLYCCSLFAANYSEDNAAYWYQKAFNDLKKIYETDDFGKSDDGIKISNLKSLEEFNKLKPETKKVFEGALKSFIADLKKAKEQKKCLFWEMALNDKDENKLQFQDTRMIFRGFRMANALAWYAISVNKPEVAGTIWQTMLNVSIMISEHNLIMLRTIVGGITVKLVIPSLDNYLKNGASDEFKTKFVKYLKKWPKSIFDIKDSIKVFYEYQKSNIDLYAQDQKYLAVFFGADMRCLQNEPSTIEPSIEEDRECASRRRIVAGAMEMFQMDESEGNVMSMGPDFSSIEDEKNRRRAQGIWREREYLKKDIKRLEGEDNNKEIKKDDFGDDDFEDEPSVDELKSRLVNLDKKLEELGVVVEDLEKDKANDFTKMNWDEIISLLEKSSYLRGKKDYSCPNNGNRTIKVVKRGDETLFEIACDCSKMKNPMDGFKPDSEPMKLAKAYKETQFDNDKKQMFEYYEMLLKLDHTKPMTEEEMTALDSVEIYKNNVLLSWLGLGYKSFRKSFDEYQKILDDFIKKYDN